MKANYWSCFFPNGNFGVLAIKSMCSLYLQIIIMIMLYSLHSKCFHGAQKRNIEKQAFSMFWPSKKWGERKNEERRECNAEFVLAAMESFCWVYKNHLNFPPLPLPSLHFLLGQKFTQTQRKHLLRRHYALMGLHCLSYRTHVTAKSLNQAQWTMNEVCFPFQGYYSVQCITLNVQSCGWE